MEIDETINKWFKEIENKLKESALSKNNIDQMVNASLGLVDNYLNNAMRILQQDSKLPAMALLRVLNQFSSRVVWVLIGHNRNENELQNRFKQWEKDSYIKEMGLCKKIVKFYEGNEKTQFENTIKTYKQEINKLKTAGVKELPPPEQILEEVFGTRQIATGQYSRLHQAIHPDLLLLGETIKNNGTSYMYNGDVDEKIDDLKFECLICAHRFFKEICRYYKLDLLSRKIENEFKMLTPKSYMKNG